MSGHEGRRGFLSFAGAAALLIGAPGSLRAEEKSDGAGKPEDKDDVGAVEDLMREHGVIRRVLVVYRELAIKLRAKPAAVSASALNQAAKLMRTFGEDYHERQLEEAHIFPAVQKAGGLAASEIETLLAQHRRGREVTDYLLSATAKNISIAQADVLAQTLESFARMYEEHTAHEDTIVFPAWKKALTAKQLDELGDLFEEIEHKTFGKDGFDDAVEQIAAIEKRAGVELASLIAPLPPKA